MEETTPQNPTGAPRDGQSVEARDADIESQRDEARSQLRPTVDPAGGASHDNAGPSSETAESIERTNAEFEAQREEVISKLRPTLDEVPPEPSTPPADAQTPDGEDRVADIEAQREEVKEKLRPTLDDAPAGPAPDRHLQTGEPGHGEGHQETLEEQIKDAGTANPPEAAADQTVLTRTDSQRRSGSWIQVPNSQDSTDPELTPVAVSAEDLGAVGEGAHGDPHSILGSHPGRDSITIRTLRPFAQEVAILTGSAQAPQRTPMTHEAHGVWVAVLPGTEAPDYRISVRYPGGTDTVVDDPYRFLPTLGEMDIHLIGEGRHEELWKVLGAHVRSYPAGPMGEVSGVAFAVWAPNARAVRVASDENHWDGRAHQLRAVGSSGVWEIFIPGMGAGSRYKYQILGKDGVWREKADPMAQHTEVPPLTASVVHESSYTWNDDAWMARRAAAAPHQEPMSTYEVHLGSWRPGLNYRQMAQELVDYIRTTGFTHVEFMPLAEHPFGGSWGYQVTGYYAPTSRFGTPDELRYLIDQLHQAGIGVIMDWVPAHFPKDEWALARFDGEPLYEHADPRRGEQPDWGTLVFDYGRAEVRNFLVANALYWLEEFHIDGLRVDAVASMLYLDYSRPDGQWLPNEFGGREHLEAIRFLQEVNATAYKRVPGIVTIAEESTAWPGVTQPTHVGGLGFGFKWNMGWMHDSLDYVEKEPIYRKYHHGSMTFSLVYAFTENYVLPISHDEVVHGKGSLLRKMPGDRWQQVANLRNYLAYMWAHPGKKTLFMGQEFGQEAEWSEARGLDWWLLDQPLHSGALNLVGDLNRLYRNEPALYEVDFNPSGFEWIDSNAAEHNVFSFVRRDLEGNPLVVVCNFAGAPHEGYRLGLPAAGIWQEVLNTDDTRYGGSGVINPGLIRSEDVPAAGREHSAPLRLPPLGTIFLKPQA